MNLANKLYHYRSVEKVAFQTALTSPPTTDVQKAHRRAAIGISLRHSGHFLDTGSAEAVSREFRTFQAFMGATIKKYTAAAISRKLIKALRKVPYVMLAPWMVRVSAEKSGFPKIAAISGVMMLVTKEVTTAPNAAPMTTATAKSTTFPRMMNARKPFSMISSSGSRIEN
jgi:hypothetical protein